MSSNPRTTPESERLDIATVLAENYVRILRQRNQRNLAEDEAREWYTGVSAVLAHPMNFGLETQPAASIPTFKNFIDACNDQLHKAA